MSPRASSASTTSSYQLTPQLELVAQDRRITADSLELIATSNAYRALEQVKEPRCGRRYGIVIAVGGILAAAVPDALAALSKLGSQAAK